MKRIKSGILIVILTAAAVLTGFSLPGLTADHQEREYLSRVDVHESEAVSFPTSDHILDCIRLFSDGYMRVELDRGNVCSEDKIREICLNFLEDLRDTAGLVSADAVFDGVDEISVFLAIRSARGETSDWPVYESASAAQSVGEAGSGDEDLGQQEEAQELSAIIWSCWLSDQSGRRYGVWIDDMSGKAIAFICECGGILWEDKLGDIALAKGYASGDTQAIRELIVELLAYKDDSLAEFLREYYNLTAVDIVPDDDFESVRIYFTDQDREQVSAPVYTDGKSILFNLN